MRIVVREATEVGGWWKLRTGVFGLAFGFRDTHIA